MNTHEAAEDALIAASCAQREAFAFPMSELELAELQEIADEEGWEAP